MPEGVYITGIGAISSIGRGVEETRVSLANGRSGIGAIDLLDTVHKNEIPAAEVPAHDKDLLESAGGGDPTLYSRSTLLGELAAKEAMANAGIDDEDHSRTGLISGNTAGGMCLTEQYYRDYLSNGSKNAYIMRHDCGDSTEQIGRDLGINGFMTTINTACSSSANSIMLGARMIRMGMIDRAVAGGMDALAKFTLNGFNTLFILDREYCKPFDNERKGLNLGEGSGFLVLEREALVEEQGKQPLATLMGYGNSNDAYHQTASSPEGEGAFSAMEKALVMSGLRPEKIDHVNAHGTGTPNNDLSEGKALQRLFGEGKVPPFSSTKGYTGHTLGASGGLEAVFSVMELQEGMIYPNLNFTRPMEELELEPRSEFQERKQMSYVLSNSFGFGGNNSSLIFAKC